MFLAGEFAGPFAPAESIPSRGDELRGAWIAAAAIGLWTVAMLVITIVAHPTPLYYVETDLIGEYLPAARELLNGTITAAHYTYKGPGYPALLAAFVAIFGDGFLAARVLGVIAAAAAAWLVFLLVARRSGPRVGGVALAITLMAPAFVRYTIEAGTDMPALVLMLGATVLALDARSLRGAACAGLLAGCSILTRSNAVFLVPAAAWALLAGTDRGRRIAGYAAGLMVPLAAWTIVCAQSGVAIHDRNFLNVAYELYGRDLPWGTFETTIGSRFGSLVQVLLYDPWHAAARIATNVIEHRGRDGRELVPVWIGLIAAPGLILLARARAWRVPLLGAGWCALILATVFYNARFALYLLPFYAAAAALALAWAADATARLAPRLKVPVAAAACALLLASGVTAALGITGPLATAPHEVRRAGGALAQLGGAHDGVMARKPHVAHFAGMRYVPMPENATLFELVKRARSANAQWLFYSPCERANRPEFAVLADSGVSLPGLEPVAWDAAPDHYYALYRLSTPAIDSAGFAARLATAIERYAGRHRNDPDAMLFVAFQWNALGRHRDAIRSLDDMRRRGANDDRTEQVRSDAYLALGQLDSAGAACERSIAMAQPLASRWARLGEIRGRERRFAETRHCYERAVALEPANLAWLERLAFAHLALNEPRAAAAVFDRCVRLAPRNLILRRNAMGAWQLAGDASRVEAHLSEGVRLGLDRTALLGADVAPATTGPR